MYTLQEAAEYLHISYSTLRRIMKNKQIEYVIVCGGKRFMKKHLDAYLERNTIRVAS